MSKHVLRVADYLEHIEQAIEKIERYVQNMDEADFLCNGLVQDAVIRNIEIIGEAANNIKKCDSEFSQSGSKIPLSVMYAMRNRVAHGYHAVDLEIIWRTVQNDLPLIRLQVLKLLGQLLTATHSTGFEPPTEN